MSDRAADDASEDARWLAGAAAEAGVALGAVPRGNLLAAASGRRAALGAAVPGDELEGYPVLVRLRTQVSERWRARVRAFLDHVAADHRALGASAPVVDALDVLDTPLGALAFTLRVTLAGTRWIYRARDLRLTAWFHALEATLSPRLAYPLHARQLVAEDGRAWDEHVDPAPVADAGDIHAFFHRAGALARLLERCAGEDVHAHNVIAVGTFPVLVDLEALFAPRPEVASRAFAAWRDGPLWSGFLGATLVGEPGVPAIEIGGLHPGGELVVPVLIDGTFRTVHVEATIPAPIGAHVEAIVAGYEDMERALDAAGPALATRLSAARTLVRRRLVRGGAGLLALVHASLAPAMLRSEETRDHWLTSLALDAAEHAALRDAEIPYVFEPVGDHPVIAAPAPRDHAGYVASIRTAIALRDDRGAPASSARRTFAPASRTALAVELGDAILARAFAGLEWQGVRWLPAAGTRRFDVLDTSLLSGAAGLGLLFAYLARITDTPRFRDAARGTLARVPATPERWVGGHVGLGGAIYALARAGALLDDGALVDQAATYVRMAPRRPLRAGPWDLTLGVAGFLAGALAISAPPLDAVTALHAAWTRGDGSTVVLPGGLPPGLPDVATGIAMILARCAERLGDPRWLVTWSTPPRAPPAELMDELEAALDRGDRATALDRAAALVARRHATGRWLGDTAIVEEHHLSVVDGLGGIALALLRIEAPDVVRSVRTLA